VVHIFTLYRKLQCRFCREFDLNANEHLLPHTSGKLEVYLVSTTLESAWFHLPDVTAAASSMAHEVRLL